MSKTNSPEVKLSARTKKPTPEKKSTRRRVRAEICRLDITDGSTLDKAIQTLTERREQHSKDYSALRIESIQGPYSDNDSLWLIGDRDETDREVSERKLKEAQALHWEKKNYERLKAKFEK